MNFGRKRKRASNSSPKISDAEWKVMKVALRNDGSVVAWGNDAFGQIDVPSDVANVTAIATGDYHSLALKRDGTVVAWGSNASGQTNVPAGLTISLRLRAEVPTASRWTSPGE